MAVRPEIKPINKSFPGRLESFFRMGGTIKLVNALMHDTRVSPVRKVLFSLLLTVLLVGMIFPELMMDGFLATILPFISTIIGIPLEAGIDWFAFIALLPVLLQIFPSGVMQEHYLRIFKKQELNKVALDHLDRSATVFDAQVLPGTGS